MLHPVGPLPASVYWRRRAVAFAGLVAVLLLFWAVLPGGGDDGPRDSAAAVGSPSPTEPAAAPTSAGPSGLTASAATGDPGRAPDDSGPVGGGSAATAAPTTPKPTPSPAPEPCTDAALRLTVAPAQPAYLVGQAPVLRLQVRNVGTLSCIRDLGAALQEVLLYRGTQRLWSSNDCYPEGQRDPEVMRPGVVHTFSVTWSGLSSQPKCAGTRTMVGAGSYTLVGRLGTLISPRAPLTLRAA